MANVRLAWHVARTDDILNVYRILIACDGKGPSARLSVTTEVDLNKKKTED
jgi:hypothetical protein